MSKRSRAVYEAELQNLQSPFVVFGTPLPPVDPDVRDDGSYVPVWKQEVRDDKGRRRLHGAFTGGWSAGYYNTVGSKEGWTPSTFVSSRTNRRKDDPKSAQLRPEDFMDDEDLADAEEARKIQTSHAFSGLGGTEDDASIQRSTTDRGLVDLFRVQGETMGAKLLKKMGWKDGQGIGPKVRRTARLGVGRPGEAKPTTYLFAPENVVVVQLVKKTNRKGLGYGGEARLAAFGSSARDANDSDDDDGENGNSSESLLFSQRPKLFSSRQKEKKATTSTTASSRGGGFGVGVLNDTGSDEEDPYDTGPRISFNRVVGGDKKKKKAKPKSSDEIDDSAGATTSKLVFSKKRSIFGKSAGRACHDGRPPLAGFVLGRQPDALISEVNATGKYPPPTIPPDWVSSKQSKASTTTSQQTAGDGYLSVADAAKAAKMDPRLRAAALGEAQLPGKSVFDFLSSAARDRIAAATGRSDLPQARGEIPAEYAMTEGEKHEQFLKEIPSLDKPTAVAAISRGARGSGPYQDNETKRARYRAYLEYQAGIIPAASLPPRPAGLKDEDWLREFHEFANCARIFKPMSGLMASRFTTSTSSTTAGNGSGASDDKPTLVSRPPPKPQDPAEEAAKMGMYGPLTRSVQEFFPTRLLCKRLGVKLPANVQPDGHQEATSYASSSTGRPSYSGTAYADYGSNNSRGGGWGTTGDSRTAQADKPGSESLPAGAASTAAGPDTATGQGQTQTVVANTVVQADRNEALEGQRAGDDVFRAVFGDSDDDED